MKQQTNNIDDLSSNREETNITCVHINA